jgi:protein tyrosine/serine phosphatase
MTAQTEEIDEQVPKSAGAPKLPSPFVNIEGCPNVRDIGNYPVINPLNSKLIGHLLPGIIFRGSDTTSITEAGMVKFKELGITTQFDLRSTQQIDRAGGVKEIDGVVRYWTPIFGPEEYTIDKAGDRYRQYAGDGTEGIVQAFTEIMTHGAPAFKKIILHIASLLLPTNNLPSDYPCGIYISCTTGNNRTGPFIAILLSYLGVPDDVVVKEYGLSEQGLASTRAKTVARLRSNSKFAASFDESELDYRAGRMVGAREESMVAFLETVRKKWGGPEGYLMDMLGLDQALLNNVKAVLLATT